MTVYQTRYTQMFYTECVTHSGRCHMSKPTLITTIVNTRQEDNALRTRARVHPLLIVETIPNEWASGYRDLHVPM